MTFLHYFTQIFFSPVSFAPTYFDTLETHPHLRRGAHETYFKTQGLLFLIFTVFLVLPCLIIVTATDNGFSRAFRESIPDLWQPALFPSVIGVWVFLSLLVTLVGWIFFAIRRWQFAEALRWASPHITEAKSGDLALYLLVFDHVMYAVLLLVGVVVSLLGSFHPLLANIFCVIILPFYVVRWLRVSYRLVKRWTHTSPVKVYCIYVLVRIFSYLFLSLSVASIIAVLAIPSKAFSYYLPF